MSTHAHARSNALGPGAPFPGFALPTSNTIYAPNQFFDVCLPHRSRGAVRLVAYLIRQTLGWCDAEGRPRHERVSVSYRELEDRAGVSHSMIRPALDETERGGFIRCVHQGRPGGPATAGVRAAYELAWDETPHYVKDPAKFRGFFAGEGNRTYIPNQFFDCVVPHEPLATIQVVGAIIRFSIGFVNKYGHRRQHAALSYKDLQRYTRIASPRVLSRAIASAIERNYIERVEEGFFDPRGGASSRAACYALKWAAHGVAVPAAPKSEAAEDRSEKVSGGAPKSEAADRSEKVSGIQITSTNNISKQQPAAVAAFERLRAEGFDDRAAEAIARRYPAERIERQTAWIGQRKVKSNRLGMLRTAIDQDWAPPAVGQQGVRELRRRNSDRPAGAGFRDALEQTQRRLLGESPATSVITTNTTP